MGFILVVVLVIAIYVSVKLFKSKEEKDKRDKDWDEIKEVLTFLDDKNFDEMEHEDFDRAREKIVEVLERENIHPAKLMAMQGELEFNFVKMVIPEFRDREVASEIEEDEMGYIEREMEEKFNVKMANGVMDSLRDYRKLYENGG